MVTLPFSHEYYIGPDHQVSDDQLLYSTVQAQAELDDSPFAFEQYEHILDSIYDGPRPSAVIRDISAPSSATTAVAVHVPYANRVTPIGDTQDIIDLYSDDHEIVEQAKKRINKISWNMVTKHMFLQQALARAGVVDEEGLPLSVVLVSAPSGDYKRQSKPAEKKALRKGDLTPLADDTLEVVSAHGFNQVYSLGYSLGGLIVPKLVERSSEYGVEVLGTVIAEPPMRTSVPKTVVAYLNLGGRDQNNDPRARANVPKSGGWTDGSPLLIRRLEQTQGGWIGNILADKSTNLRLLAGMSKPEQFMSGLLGLVQEGMPPTTVLFSRHSRISNGIEEFLASSGRVESALIRGDLQIMTADGHNAVDDQHGFGENHPYYVDAMSRGVLFANQRRN